MTRAVFFFLLIVKFTFGQTDSSKVVVYFGEKGAIVYLNNKKIVLEKKQKYLPVGNYKVQAWAPHHKLFEDSFTVVSNQNKFYTKKMRFTEEYKTYRRKQHLVKLTYIIPLATAIGIGLNTYNTYKEMDRNIASSYFIANDLKKDYDEGRYEKSNDYYKEKDKYEALIEKQKKLKKEGIVISSACMGTAAVFFVFDLIRKRKPFEEKPLLTRITPGYNVLTKQVCLNIKL